MRALVYHGPGLKSWDNVANPTIQLPTDAIVKIDTATICGTDLHILKGDVPAVKPGTILGHEAVGTIVETGAAVTNFQIGDHVPVSCITSCGRCRFCKEGRYGQCTGGGGWIFGHLINGLQAEYARIPFADNSLYQVSSGPTDEQVLFLSDILPTSFEVGVQNGGVRPGDTVAIVGAGPIGLAAVMTAKLYTPAQIIVIDLDDGRLARRGVRRRRNDQQRPRGCGQASPRADGWSRRRRRDRGGRDPDDVRARSGADPTRRSARQRRGTRQARNPAPGEALDQGRHDHHGPGGHADHPAAALPDRRRQARPHRAGDPSILDGRGDEGI